MDSMEEKLNSVLGNPDMMRQIMQMAQSLGASSPDPPKEAPHEPENTQLSGLMSDPALLQKLASVAQRSGIDSQQRQLLAALRPYLSLERIAKLEKAMRAAKMAGLASDFLGSGALSMLTGR